MYLLVANTTNNNFFPNILHVRDITRDRSLLMFNVSCVSVKKEYIYQHVHVTKPNGMA